jgi:hypothetical protein
MRYEKDISEFCAEKIVSTRQKLFYSLRSDIDFHVDNKYQQQYGLW